MLPTTLGMYSRPRLDVRFDGPECEGPYTWAGSVTVDVRGRVANDVPHEERPPSGDPQGPFGYPGWYSPPSARVDIMQRVMQEWAIAAGGPY